MRESVCSKCEGTISQIFYKKEMERKSLITTSKRILTKNEMKKAFLKENV